MKTLLNITIICCVLQSTLIIAQTPTFLWAKKAGSTGTDWGNGITKDQNGNIYLTGIFSSAKIIFDGDTLTKAGSDDIFVVKYNGSTGAAVWAERAGGIGSDISRDITTDDSGNVFITGYFGSATMIIGSDTLTNLGNTDLFIAKYDGSGNALWAISFGGTGDDFSYSISTDSNGNVFITGGFDSPYLTFGSTTLTNAGNNDYFIAKVDMNGSVLWAKSGGDNSDEYGSGISTDNNGNVFVTGGFESTSITFGSTNIANTYNVGNTYDIFIAKYDPSGNVLWAKGAGGTNGDRGYDITTDNNGNVIVTGYFYSFTLAIDTIILNNEGNNDIFIAKLDNSGNWIWAESIGGLNDDFSYSITTDNSSNIYLSGGSNTAVLNIGDDELTGSGKTDILLLKYDSNGNVKMAKKAGGNNFDVCYSAVADDNGNMYFTGFFYSANISFGTTQLTAAGSGDIFIGKLSTITGITEYTGTAGNFIVFPNPGSGSFQALFEGDLILNDISVYDITGKIIYQYPGDLFTQTSDPKSTQIIHLNIGDHPPGIYYLTATFDKGTIAKKIIVEKK